MAYRKRLLAVLGLVSLAGCATPTRSPVVPPASLPAPAAVAAPRATDAPTVHPLALRLYERALAAVRAGRDAEAERDLNAVLAREPALADAHANLGMLYQRTGRGALAVQAFERAIALDPKRAAYHNALGIAHRNDGRFADARRAYERALDLDSSYAYAHLNLAILSDLYLDQPEKALLHYERYRELVPAEASAVAKWIADLKQRSRRAAEEKGGRNG